MSTGLMFVYAAILGLMAAALFFGLWLGERGRRQAAERMITYGSPEELKHRPVTSGPVADAESRYAAASKEFTEEAIEKATAQIEDAYRIRGVIVSHERARAEAASMLSGADVGLEL